MVFSSILYSSNTRYIFPVRLVDQDAVKLRDASAYSLTVEGWLSFVSKSNNNMLLLNKEMPIPRISSAETLDGYVDSTTAGKSERINCIFQAFTKVSSIFRIVNHSINPGFVMPISECYILDCYLRVLYKFFGNLKMNHILKNLIKKTLLKLPSHFEKFITWKKCLA